MSGILSRFSQSCPFSTIFSDPPSDILTILTDIGQAASGYAQQINGTSIPSPLLPNADPNVGAFVRDAGLQGEAARWGVFPEYTPASVGGGTIGNQSSDLAIGDSAIDFEKPYHSTVTFTTVPGNDGTGSFSVGTEQP